jgi:hypothetical protein
MRQRYDRRPKGLLILGILFGAVVSATPALALAAIPVPEPGALTLLMVGGGLAGAISLGRSWRKRRDANRRRDDQ